MVDWRPILLVVGVMLAWLSGFMLFPISVDFYKQDPDSKAFLYSAVLTAIVGISLILPNRGTHNELNLRQAFIMTASCWIVACFFAALPIYFSSLQLSFADAWFEATSGITTTGSTVITDLESTPPGILLWRSLLNWIGGLGVIVLAVALLPMLRIGGMQLFRTESSDTSEKILPRAAQTAKAILIIYISITAIIALC